MAYELVDDSSEMALVDRDEVVDTLPSDGAARPSTLADSNNTYWVSGAQYDYAGRMASLNYLTGYGSGSQAAASEARTYNANTGQLASLAWSGAGVWGLVQYAYSATQNNGQITQATDTVSGETIAYQYDALKRLTSAASTPINGSTPTAWTQTYQYDGFGNLTAKVLNGTTTPIPVNAATNQLSNASYDLNGNMISGAGATLTYDDANRMATASETSGGQEYYGYDASNKRVYRVMASGQEQITVYGAYGEKLGVYGIQAGSCNYSYGYGSSPCVTGFTPLSTSIWFAGRLIMDSGNGVVQDRLGTNRASGARFYPYDEITSTNNDREKFATYTRDSYTGLDYADQRFYASTYGRFNTPDPFGRGARRRSPLSWNGYSYTLGDPVNNFDPSGQTCLPRGSTIADNGDGQGCSFAGQPLSDFGTFQNTGSTPQVSSSVSFPPCVCDLPLSPFGAAVVIQTGMYLGTVGVGVFGFAPAPNTSTATSSGVGASVSVVGTCDSNSGCSPSLMTEVSAGGLGLAQESNSDGSVDTLVFAGVGPEGTVSSGLVTSPNSGLFGFYGEVLGFGVGVYLNLGDNSTVVPGSSSPTGSGAVAYGGSGGADPSALNSTTYGMADSQCQIYPLANLCQGQP